MICRILLVCLKIAPKMQLLQWNLSLDFRENFFSEEPSGILAKNRGCDGPFQLRDRWVWQWQVQVSSLVGCFVRCFSQQCSPMPPAGREGSICIEYQWPISTIQEYHVYIIDPGTSFHQEIWEVEPPVRQAFPRALRTRIIKTMPFKPHLIFFGYFLVVPILVRSCFPGANFANLRKLN